MTRLFHRIRLVPIVLLAASGLFLLKVAGIVMAGGYTLGAGHQARIDRAIIESKVIGRQAETAEPPAQVRQRSWAQEMLGYPDITGSVGGGKPAPKGDASAPEKPVDPKVARPPAKAVEGTVVSLDAPQVSPSERALLERLSERRRELEKRQSELEMRDTLLKAAEKKLEERLGELKEAEARIVAATQHKEEAELGRLKNLVTMYENMKAKDAAKIFDRLDLKLATEVARMIQPRRMSEILAQMAPDVAQRLTMELANRVQSEPRAAPRPQELPKIEGRPSGS